MQRFFCLSGRLMHQMVVALEKAGLITRRPGESSGGLGGIIPDLLKPSAAEADVTWLAHSRDRMVSTRSQSVRSVMAKTLRELEFRIGGWDEPDLINLLAPAHHCHALARGAAGRWTATRLSLGYPRSAAEGRSFPPRWEYARRRYP
jgi:hypothetical protein